MGTNRIKLESKNRGKEIRHQHIVNLTAKEHLFCVNCGNELPTSDMANDCPKCGHPIRIENRITKYTVEGKPLAQGQEGISPKASGDNRGELGGISHKKAEEKKQEMSLGFAIFVLALIIFFVAAFAWWIWERYVTDQMFDKGCLAMGYNMWGFVDEWDCP